MLAGLKQWLLLLLLLYLGAFLRRVTPSTRDSLLSTCGLGMALPLS